MAVAGIIIIIIIIIINISLFKHLAENFTTSCHVLMLIAAIAVGLITTITIIIYSRSQWQRGLRVRSAAEDRGFLSHWGHGLLYSVCVVR
jgi:uncharacterized membrane protein